MRRDTRARSRRIAEVGALPHAMSHNDSKHLRPLWAALGAGCTALEVDVWLLRGRLYVGHSVPRLTHSLRRVYLDPLAAHVEACGGTVFEDFSRPVTLALDVKTHADGTREAIERELSRYDGLLSTWREDRYTPGTVEVILTGGQTSSDWDVPRRWSGVDGRLRDGAPDRPPFLMPWRSDSWPERFAWAGEGSMPEPEHEELRRLIDRAHDGGYLARFWGTPDRPGPARAAVWSQLLDAGADYLCTDDLRGARDFLTADGRR